MAIWNKKIGFATLSLGLLAMTPNMTEAADCYTCEPVCDPCNQCADSCFGGLDFGIDFLYWKPAIDDLDFCARYEPVDIVSTGFNPTGTAHHIKYHGVCPGWEPGFRLRLAKEDCWCDWKLGLSYTRVKSTQHRKCDSCTECETSNPIVIVGPPLFGADRFGTGADVFNFAKAKWESTYQTWDVLFSYDIDCCRCHVFTPFLVLKA